MNTAENNKQKIGTLMHFWDLWCVSCCDTVTFNQVYNQVYEYTLKIPHKENVKKTDNNFYKKRKQY